MAQVANQSPPFTKPTDLSETNHPCDNQLKQPSLESPNNQQNSNCFLSLAITNGLQISPSSTDEQQDSSQCEHESDRQFYREHRGWLMIVAILAAGATYQAGLSPPGSFWQSDEGHFKAGNPILSDEFSKRYKAFFYLNGVSFVSSLVIIILLMNKHFHRNRIRIKVLKITMGLDLFSFMAAYAAGSCRNVTTSIVIIVFLCAVFFYVAVFSHCYLPLRKIACSARSRTRISVADLARTTEV